MKEEVHLLMTGSFNPVTVMHLRMMEIAKDHLRERGIVASCGLLSPVHDSYSKESLISITHRSAMLKLALETSDWLELSSWESEQAAWTPSYQVLKYHKDRLYLPPKAEIAKRKKVLSASTPNDVNGNPKNARVLYVCGADLLASFAVPNLWKAEDIEKILVEHGLIVITRAGYDIDCIIYENDLLYKHKKHISIVREFIENTVSSTKIRRACSRGLSIKYLVTDKVEQYIKKHKLYSTISKSGNSGTDANSLQFDTPTLPIRPTNSKKSSNSTKIKSNKKSDLESDVKVGRVSRRSKNIAKHIPK